MDDGEYDQSHDARVKRFLTALDLFDSGVQMRRAQLARQFPEATEEELRWRLREWLHTRPGAEHGDCQGRVREK